VASAGAPSLPLSIARPLALLCHVPRPRSPFARIGARPLPRFQRRLVPSVNCPVAPRPCAIPHARLGERPRRRVCRAAFPTGQRPPSRGNQPEFQTLFGALHPPALSPRPRRDRSSSTWAMLVHFPELPAHETDSDGGMARVDLPDAQIPLPCFVPSVGKIRELANHRSQHESPPSNAPARRAPPRPASAQRTSHLGTRPLPHGLFASLCRASANPPNLAAKVS
jgi:hypothetical protein